MDRRGLRGRPVATAFRELWRNSPSDANNVSGIRGFHGIANVMIPPNLKTSLQGRRIWLWPAWQIERR